MLLGFEKPTLFSLLLCCDFISYLVTAVILSSSFCWLWVYSVVCFPGLLMYGVNGLPFSLCICSCARAWSHSICCVRGVGVGLFEGTGWGLLTPNASGRKHRFRWAFTCSYVIRYFWLELEFRIQNWSILYVPSAYSQNVIFFKVLNDFTYS